MTDEPIDFSLVETVAKVITASLPPEFQFVCILIRPDKTDAAKASVRFLSSTEDINLVRGILAQTYSEIGHRELQWADLPKDN